MRALTLGAVALLLPGLALAGFSASSEKRSSHRNDAGTHTAAAALDGDPATAWMIDPEQPNEGQWLELDLPKGKVDKVSLVVGWAQTDKTWVDHARLKKARLEVISMARGDRKVVFEKDLDLRDVRERQTIDLPDPEVGDELEGGKVRLVVTEVYPGKDYEHLGLGEILVHMAEFDATVRNFVEASSEADGHGGALLVDDSTRTAWVAAEGDEAPSITVNAGRFSVSSIGVAAGPTTHARPKRIEVQQSSATRTYDVPDKPGTHWFEVPSLFGYTGSNFGDITVRVLETWPGSAGKPVAIGDVRFKATALDPF